MTCSPASPIPNPWNLPLRDLLPQTHSIEGDYNMVSVSEVEKLATGDGTGRVRR